MSDGSKLTTGQMRIKLCALGLLEDGMSRKDMADMLAVVENSRISAIEERKAEDIADNAKTENREASAPCPPRREPPVPERARAEASESKDLKRRYVDVLDRRMPWTLFSEPNRLSLDRKTSILGAYREQQRYARYRRAKSSVNFIEWDEPLNIPIGKRRNKNVVKKVDEKNSPEPSIEKKTSFSDSASNGTVKPKIAIQCDENFADSDKTSNRENEKRNISNLIDPDSPEQYSKSPSGMNTRNRLKKIKI